MVEKEKQLEEVLENVDVAKRDFVKKAIIGAGFALPFLVSYSMNKFRLGPPDAYAS